MKKRKSLHECMSDIIGVIEREPRGGWHIELDGCCARLYAVDGLAYECDNIIMTPPPRTLVLVMAGTGDTVHLKSSTGRLDKRGKLVCYDNIGWIDSGYLYYATHWIEVPDQADISALAQELYTEVTQRSHQKED